MVRIYQYFINRNTMQQQNKQIRNDAPHSIKINTDKLQTQFQCTVCLNQIEDAYITRCGHVFCKACIEQVVNRHHRCPFCNQQLKQFKTDVFKNYHFNTIKKIVEDQKKVQTSKYLDKVFASDMKSKMQIENQQIEELLKPIQQKVVENCANALLEYRKFVISLYQLQKSAEQKKALHGLSNIRDHNTIIKQMSKYMVSRIPNPVVSPQIIEKPTQIHITLPGNKVNKNVIKLAPMATFESLLPYIQKICSECNVQLRGKIEDKVIVNGVQVSIKDRLGMLAGDTIKIERGIPFVEKVYCYTYKWEKAKSSAFYICNTCNTKWICQSCVLHCHAGHEQKLQLKDHKSDWAICYCVTKCECKAINKNSMEAQ